MRMKENSAFIKITVYGKPFEILISKEDEYHRIKVWEGKRKIFMNPALYIITEKPPYKEAVKEIKEYLQRKYSMNSINEKVIAGIEEISLEM